MNPTERKELCRLLARAADGERDALDPLYAVAWPAVRGFCRRLVAEADVDDAAQEALVRAFERVSSFDPDRDGLTWLLTIAAWECRTSRRRASRRREVEPPAASLVDPGFGPDERLERRELLAAAAEVLGTMSPDDAATLVAAWTDDRAARAALAPATFRKRLSRALARFRAGWRSRHDVP